MGTAASTAASCCGRAPSTSLLHHFERALSGSVVHLQPGPNKVTHEQSSCLAPEFWASLQPIRISFGNPASWKLFQVRPGWLAKSAASRSTPQRRVMKAANIPHPAFCLCNELGGTRASSRSCAAALEAGSHTRTRSHALSFVHVMAGMPLAGSHSSPHGLRGPRRKGPRQFWI